MTYIWIYFQSHLILCLSSLPGNIDGLFTLVWSQIFLYSRLDWSGHVYFYLDFLLMNLESFIIWGFSIFAVCTQAHYNPYIGALYTVTLRVKTQHFTKHNKISENTTFHKTRRHFRLRKRWDNLFVIGQNPDRKSLATVQCTFLCSTLSNVFEQILNWGWKDGRGDWNHKGTFCNVVFKPSEPI